MIRFNRRLREETSGRQRIQRYHTFSTTDLVSFSEGGRSVFGTGENASTERPDTGTAMLGPGGVENVILNLELQELRSTQNSKDGAR